MDIALLAHPPPNTSKFIRMAPTTTVATTTVATTTTTKTTNGTTTTGMKTTNEKIETSIQTGTTKQKQNKTKRQRVVQ